MTNKILFDELAARHYFTVTMEGKTGKTKYFSDMVMKHYSDKEILQIMLDKLYELQYS